MKRPFQVGDRVAAYAGDQRIIGRLEIKKGTDYLGNPVFSLCMDSDDPLARVTMTVNSKQCRRLVPKKRREIWVNEYEEPLKRDYYDTAEEAEDNAIGITYIRTVRFVEAKEKAKK